MKSYLYVVMILSLNGCGTNDERDTNYTAVNATRVSNYGAYGSNVKEFKDMVESWTGTRPSDRLEGIAFRDVSIDRVWATCKIMYTDSSNSEIYRAVIELDPNMRGMSAELFKITLWHELGHCIMNSGHVDDKNDLMYPYTAREVINAETDLRTINYMQRLAEGRNS